MADYVVAPCRSLFAIGELDPAAAATLTDAALTSYHAIRTCRDRLGERSMVVVIGLGGLGNMALQILKVLKTGRVVGIDHSPAALEANRRWADSMFGDISANTEQEIVAMCGSYGVDAVFDFVGNDATMAFARNVVARGGAIRIVGLSGGTLPFVARSAGNPFPRGATIMAPYSGTYGDLAEVISLTQSKAIEPMINRFPLAKTIEALNMLEAGQIRGRAVLIP
jgi:propanol-preferring alcohol dehydrogenase